MMKLVDGYGFIKSDQINCDIFFSLHHTTGINTKAEDQEVVGKNVTFQIKSGAKKGSMEARRVMMVEEEPRMMELEGVLVSWVRTGCLIQVTSGLGAEKSHNRIFAPDSECLGLEAGDVGVEVIFHVHMDTALKVLARNVRARRMKNHQHHKLSWRGANNPDAKISKPTTEEVKVKVSRSPAKTENTETRRKFVIQDLTNLELSEELMKKLDVVSSDEISSFFESILKLKFVDLCQQLVASKVIIAVIRNLPRTKCSKVEEFITRSIVANFFMLSRCKQGCQVVMSALDNLTQSRRILIAEQLSDNFCTVDDYRDLWTHGGQLFITMLDYLDQTSLTMIGSCLLGHYGELACSIHHYKPLRSLLLHLVDSDCFDDIVEEISDDLITLSCDKFGHHIIIRLLEIAPDQVKQSLINEFQGRVVELSLDPVCHSVIVAAVKEGSSHQQGDMIEEVCRVTSKQAEMEIIHLSMDKYGHKVVLAMLR